MKLISILVLTVLFCGCTTPYPLNNQKDLALPQTYKDKLKQDNFKPAKCNVKIISHTIPGKRISWYNFQGINLRSVVFPYTIQDILESYVKDAAFSAFEDAKGHIRNSFELKIITHYSSLKIKGDIAEYKLIAKAIFKTPEEKTIWSKNYTIGPKESSFIGDNNNNQTPEVIYSVCRQLTEEIMDDLLSDVNVRTTVTDYVRKKNK